MNRTFILPKPRLISILAVTFCCLWMAGLLRAAGWQIQVVDPGGGGKHSTLLVDNASDAHAVYYDEPNNEIKYAFWDHRSGRWFKMKIADHASGYCSMALDSHQKPHIAFLNGQLNYAHWDGASWKTQTIGVGAKLIEYYTSIAIDSLDQPMITYYEIVSNSSPDSVMRLRSVRRNSQSWELSTVDRGLASGKFNSMTIGTDGIPRVAYANVKDETSGLRFAQPNGNSWETKVLEGVGAPEYMYSIKLALDKNNSPHITYTDAKRSLVKYAALKSGSWQFQVVDRLVAAGFPDRNGIALDDDGSPYISYYDAGLGALKVAHLEGAKWIIETVDDTFSGFTSSIQIANQEIIVLYYDTINNSLKCARRPVRAEKNVTAKLPEPRTESSAQ
jgi:hypothetical protein